MMDNFDNRPQVYGEVGIQSTAGAVPVKNDKGEISMQKVKVQRYISGKRPDYAQRYSSSEEEEEEEDFSTKKMQMIKKEGEKAGRRREKKDSSDSSSSDSSRSPSPSERSSGVVDARLRRLQAAKAMEKEEQGSEEEEEEDRRERLRRRRRVQEPEVVEEEEINMGGSDEEVEVKHDTKKDIIKAESDEDSDSDSSDEEMDEEAIQRRRDLMRQKAALKAQAGMTAQEILAKEEEKSGGEDEEEEESSEEETDSEEEEGARLKPVFVRAKDRLTIQEREREELKAKQAERELAKMAEERRRQTLRMVEAEVRKGLEGPAKDGETITLEQIETDDENDEVEYEAWKLREMKRLKRDREEAEAVAKEQAELERLRNLTEEERRMELQKNPKVVTNKAAKGKYKFLQKYYHRGAFYLDDEEDVLKRDTTGATLEDRFDKTVLPKVMQVKNFGRSSRTKYTHLVDQDTTAFDAAWAQESASNSKFINQHAGGMRQVFARPAAKNT